MKLTVATCQFPVAADIRKNLAFILRQMKSARRRGAQVAHFSEACLSGYAGYDLDSFAGFDWDLLTRSTGQVMALAKQLRLWVILGSTHRLTGRHKPHNSLYIISDRGQIVERYDKMFCTGDRSGNTGDLKYYTPGNHFCIFSIKGLRCAVQLCHDFRYDELCREHRRLGVDLIFYSYYNARQNATQLRRYNIWRVIVPATMQTYAANNHFWISAANSSGPVSSWAGFFVRPDGIITGRLKLNRPGVLISQIDTVRKFYDPSGPWRDRAIRSVYHSGRLVRDPRSQQRKSL